jgi:hypothetical protein
VIVDDLRNGSPTPTLTPTPTPTPTVLQEVVGAR